MINFRRYHLLKILERYQLSSLPIDSLLRSYFRAHKAVGAKDRKEICDKLYTMIRYKGLIDSQLKSPISWESRLDLLDKGSLEVLEAPEHVQVSFPKPLFDLLEEEYGSEKALDICRISNQEAPTTIRVNLQKTTRDTLFERWENLYPVTKDPHCPTALIFQKKINFFALPEFKEGLFEIQDAGSQCIASLVRAKPGDHVLDYCAGSGGKTLAFAPQMEGKGQIYLYDIRTHILVEAKKRLKRAGIQNCQILTEERLTKKSVMHRMDWILADVPCSGSGTWRRNPDLKWRFDRNEFDQLLETQRNIVQSVLPFLKEDGYIVYATCSLFAKENEEQIAYFSKHFNLHPVEPFFKSLPTENGMDGFFGAILKIKD